MAKKPNLFESIGQGVGGVLGGIGDAAGTVFQNLTTTPAARQRIASEQQIRDANVVNKAADILIRTPAEERENVLVSFNKLFDENVVALAQQVATRGQPLTVQEWRNIIGEGGEGLSESIAVGPQGFVEQGVLATPSTSKTSTSSIKSIIGDDITALSLESEVFDAEFLLDEAVKSGKKDDIAEAEKKVQAARDALNVHVAGLTGTPVTETETVIPGTREVRFFEGLLSGEKQRGDIIPSGPSRTETRLEFGRRGTATQDTAPTVLAPEPPKPAVKQKKTRASKDAKVKGAGMQALRKAFSDKEITASEFKFIQNAIRNKSMTVEQALARLEQIRGAK